MGDAVRKMHVGRQYGDAFTCTFDPHDPMQRMFFLFPFRHMVRCGENFGAMRREKFSRYDELSGWVVIVQSLAGGTNLLPEFTGFRFGPGPATVTEAGTALRTRRGVVHLFVRTVRVVNLLAQQGVAACPVARRSYCFHVGLRQWVSIRRIVGQPEFRELYVVARISHVCGDYCVYA